MKTTRTSSPNESGGALVYALVTCVIVGSTLAAYMGLANSQHRSIVRSEAWNRAVPVLEAGMEEALTQLHLSRGNLSANGWLVSSNGLSLSNNITLPGTQYYQTRSLDDSLYIVAISDGTYPTIKSQAITTVPVSGQKIVRTVKVSTAGGATFVRGLIAKGDIEWSGNIMSDSFNSSDPAQSTGGRYDVTKRKDNGSVSSVSGTLSLGGGTIYGSAGIGETGTFLSEGGIVGDGAWVDGGNTGVQPGHLETDVNLSFPDVTPPFTTGVIPPAGVVTNYSFYTNTVPVSTLAYPLGHIGSMVTNHPTSATYPAGTLQHAVTTTTTTYTYTEFIYYTNTVSTSTNTTYYDIILDSGDYYVSNIPNGSQVLVRGNARLYVENDIEMSGQSQITIGTTGSLNLYCNGDAKLGGNGVVNTTAESTRFSLWGTPGCKEVQLGGNAEFTGTIYAPQAHLHAGGGGNTRYDIVGAAIVNSAKLNGNFQFHFDENLVVSGARSSFIVTGWSEI